MSLKVTIKTLDGEVLEFEDPHTDPNELAVRFHHCRVNDEFLTIVQGDGVVQISPSAIATVRIHPHQGEGEFGSPNRT